MPTAEGRDGVGLPSDFRGAGLDAFGDLPQWEALEDKASAAGE